MIQFFFLIEGLLIPFLSIDVLFFFFLGTLSCSTTTTNRNIPFEIVTTSVLLLFFPFRLPVPFLFFFPFLSVFFLDCDWNYYYSHQPCLLWLIFTTRQIIVIIRRVPTTVSIDPSRYRVVPYLFSSLYVSFRSCSFSSLSSYSPLFCDRGIDI